MKDVRPPARVRAPPADNSSSVSNESRNSVTLGGALEFERSGAKKVVSPFAGGAATVEGPGTGPATLDGPSTGVTSADPEASVSDSGYLAMG